MNFTPKPPPRFKARNFKRNLKALRRVDPLLATRLRWPADGQHILFDADGHPYYHYYNAPTALGVAADVLEVETPQPDERQSEGQIEAGAGDGAPTDETTPLLLFGLGVGDVVEDMRRRFPQRPLILWERDPWLLRLALMRSDLSSSIASGRLQFHLGVDLVEHASLWSTLPRVVHPVLRPFYARELALLDGGLGKLRALICSGRLFVADLAESLQSKGYSLFTLDHKKLSLEEIDHLFKVFEPHAVFGINYISGLAEMCARHKRPLVVWEIDPTTSVPPPVSEAASARAHLFFYRQKTTAGFKAAGFSQSHHLPLASNPLRRRPLPLSPEQRDRYAVPVAFVGASMVGQAQVLKARFVASYRQAFGAGPAIEARAVALFDGVAERQRRDFSRFLVPELIAELAPELVSPPGAFELDPVMLLGETAAAEKRLNHVAQLGRQGVAVWGDGGWQAVTRYGALYRGQAGHWDELNRIYQCATINIDINRIYQMDIVTMRVFDVLACGGFILAEYSEDLANLFEIGVELDAYRTLEELIQKTAYYLQHPQQAQAMARRGMARVLRDHTIAQRVQAMLDSAGLLTTER